jgi:hypothetical protein
MAQEESPEYNYWNGCSTGGRQGYLLAQELGNELDGILANAPAMYWTRFATAQMWCEIAMFEEAGEQPAGAIAPASDREAGAQSSSLEGHGGRIAAGRAADAALLMRQ